MALHRVPLLVASPEWGERWLEEHAQMESARRLLAERVPKAHDVLTGIGYTHGIMFSLRILSPTGLELVTDDSSELVRMTDDKRVYDLYMTDDPLDPNDTYFCDFFPEVERPEKFAEETTGLIVVDSSARIDDDGLTVAEGFYCEGDDGATPYDRESLFEVVDRVLQLTVSS